MRHLRAQIAVAQRLHRRDDGGDAIRYVANQIIADGDTGDDGHAQDGREHHQSECIIVGGLLRRLVAARVVEVDTLLQNGIGLKPDLVHGGRVQVVGFRGNLADRIAGQLHDFLGAPAVLVPELRPLIVQRALFRRRNQGLIGCADLVVGLDHGSQRLFRRQLFFQRLRQHVLADHVAIGDDAGAQVTQHAYARHPARRDVHRVGVDGPHVPDREQPHARHGGEQEGDHGDDLGADGIPGEHGCNLLVLGARGARRTWRGGRLEERRMPCRHQTRCVLRLS